MQNRNNHTLAHTTWNQKSESQVSAKSLNGIYVEKADEFAPKIKQTKLNKNASATLKGLSRTSVGFELKFAARL